MRNRRVRLATPRSAREIKASSVKMSSEYVRLILISGSKVRLHIYKKKKLYLRVGVEKRSESRLSVNDVLLWWMCLATSRCF